MAYDIRKVEKPEDRTEFHRLPFRIYRNHPMWRPPFHMEMERIFDPADNPFFENGECERYLVTWNRETVARFAVMNTPSRDKVLDPVMGGLGFIELYNDQQLAQTIVDFATEWHRKRGYRAMRGPVNFGENDNYWGLLIENFDEPPIYGMHYHPPYYRTLIEGTGARKRDDHLSFRLLTRGGVPDRMRRIAGRLQCSPSITVRPVGRRNLYRDAEIIRKIYNQAWQQQDIVEREREFVPISQQTMQRTARQLKPLLVPPAVLLAFVDDRPASFLVSVPDAYELSYKTGGRLRWWDLLRVMRFRKRFTRLRTLAYGTMPEFRKMGLEALLLVEGMDRVSAACPRFELVEGAWISEKNWLMRRSVEALGCQHHKTHRTYMWEF